MTEEELEYCPDCDVAVTYDDDGEPQCDCEWEEDAAAMSMDEVAAQLRESGQEWRHWDSRYHNFRLGGYFVKKETLGQIARIEALRWKAWLNWEAHCERAANLREEIADLGECFIPQDPKKVAEQIRQEEKQGETFSEEEREEFLRPVRYHATRRERGGISSSIDHRFWTYDEPKHSGTEMEVIAAATHLGEWEQEILPDRIRRSQDPAKLDLGRRYDYEETIGRARSDRCHFLEQLLAAAVYMSGVLPKGKPHYTEVVNVQINGRNYPFEVGPHESRAARFKEWPRPSGPPIVVVPDRFELDETLIGQKPDAVRCRLGEPRRIEGPTWEYPDGLVVFNSARQGDYHCAVIRVEKQPAGTIR